MRKLLIAALALTCAPAALFGQGLNPDSLFQHLVGRWVLRGTIARQHTVHDVSFDWLLGREYVRMHEVSRERAPNGTPAYEAVVLFGRDPKTGAYACVCGWITPPRRRSRPRVPGAAPSSGIPSRSCSNTPPRQAFTRRSSMSPERIPGSGIWTTIVPECAGPSRG